MKYLANQPLQISNLIADSPITIHNVANSASARKIQYKNKQITIQHATLSILHNYHLQKKIFPPQDKVDAGCATPQMPYIQ
jgi:hypothetical protein